MVELLKGEYWSKSDAFLLPLTGISKNQKYTMKCYLFWEEYSIENYQLIVKVSYGNEREFLEYYRKFIFPIWDRSNYIIESYDFEGSTVFILDISEWALDIEMFLQGKYSKFSTQAKDMITTYHTYYNNGPRIRIWIKGSLHPTTKEKLLDDMSPIEYAIKNYGLPEDELRKVGEIGGIYDQKAETLTYLPPKGDILSFE